MLTAIGADTYQWDDGTVGPSVTVNTFGYYTVTGTNTYGCTATATAIVLVHNAPTITIVGNTDICTGSTTTLTAQGADTYLWNNGTASASLQAGNAGTYTVIGTDEYGCRGTASVTLTARPNAASDFTVEADNFYRWNGRYYTESGDYTWHGQTQYGCDSAVTLHLTIRQPVVSSDDYVSICPNELPFSYLDTTFGMGTSGENVVSFLLTTGQGYDSIVTLHLTVLPVTPPTFTVNGVISACQSSTATLSLDGSYSSVLWSTGDMTPTIQVDAPGYYWVEVTDANNCIVSSEQVHLGVSDLISESPSICMVGVENNHNLVVWEELDNENVQNYRIYRENNQANVFELLATVPASQGNAYEDTTANPSVRAYRYKVTAMDICAGETPMSDFHKTVHLTINRGIGNSWNLIWTPYEGMDFPSYRLYRGTTNNDLELIETMPSTLTSYTDYDNVNGALFYQIEVVMNGSCQRHTRDNDTYTGIRSNIVYNGEAVLSDTSVIACEHYEWHDSIYTESGDYALTQTSDLGYTGTTTLHLTIVHTPVVTIGGDTVVALGGSTTLSVENNPNWTYLWSTGETTSSITVSPDEETVYSVTVTDGPCVEEASTTVTVGTGVSEWGTTDLRIYPNPTTGIVTIELSTETAAQKPEIQVFDVYGRLLSVVETRHGTSLQTVEIDLSRYATGVYLIKVVDNGTVMAIGKVVKE